jgi:GntR family transcriptional regulator/MocR family aminotransferase
MLVTLNLDRKGRDTLQRQIVAQMRDAILSKRLPPGAELPASRALAAAYGISRNTVLQAYQWLAAEGYIETQRSARTIVSEHLPEECLRVDRGTPLSGQAGSHSAQRAPVVFRGERPILADAPSVRKKIDFWPGRPNSSLVPTRLLRKLAQVGRMANVGRALSEYGDPLGMPQLRQAIAQHLEDARGLRTSTEQVVITSGIQEALNVISRLFLAPGSEVVVENPCYRSAALVFESYGATLFPLDVDAHGPQFDRISETSAPFAYVTPSHQFPTGVTMTLERRLRLLEWAKDSGAYVVEDDYDSDYRYAGPPLTALAGLDAAESVIYLGTFSKSIGAGFRTGFMVVPPQLVEPVRTLKTLLNFGHPWIEQYLLAEFLSTRSYQQHLRRIRRSYARVRDCLLQELSRAFGKVDLWGADCGMHIMWRLPPDFPDPAAFVAATARRGVRLHTLESGGAYDFGSSYVRDSLLLGYSSLSEQEIKTAVQAMVLAFDELAGADPGENEPSRLRNARSSRRPGRTIATPAETSGGETHGVRNQ